GDLAQVELFEQTLLRHLRDVSTRRHDDVVARGALRRGELLDRLLVRVVDVGGDVAPALQDVRVVVLGPRVEVDAAAAPSAAAAAPAAGPPATGASAAAPATAAAAGRQEGGASGGARAETQDAAPAQASRDPVG